MVQIYALISIKMQFKLFFSAVLYKKSCFMHFNTQIMLFGVTLILTSCLGDLLFYTLSLIFFLVVFSFSCGFFSLSCRFINLSCRFFRCSLNSVC